MPRSRELTLAALGLLAVGALVYGPYVPHGGLYWDDWENAATTAHPPNGFLGPFDPRVLTFRPVLSLLLVVPALAGVHPAPQLALAALLTVTMAWTFFLALRTLRLGRWPAAAIALLALLFPYSAATRLWATGAINNVALVLYLLGLCAGLRALDRDGRPAARLRWAAIALQVAAILTYEVVAVAALGSVVLYAARAGRRAAWRQWRVELPFLLAATALNAIATPRRVQSPAQIAEHAWTFASQAATLMARAIAPVPGTPGLAVAAALGAAAGLSLLVARTLPAGDPRRRALGRGWALAGAGAVAVAAGYAMFVPGSADYAPLHLGTRDRVNLMAALGFALAAYGAVRVVAGLSACALPRGTGWATAGLTGLTGLGVAALAGGYAASTVRAETRWERAATLQRRVLSPLARLAARLPAGSTVYTAGHALVGPGGVPVFQRAWDLNGAIKVATRKPGLSAYPLGRRRRLDCRPGGPGPVPVLVDRPAAPRYGRSYLFDVSSGRLSAIASPAACRALNRRLALGAR